MIYWNENGLWGGEYERTKLSKDLRLQTGEVFPHLFFALLVLLGIVGFDLCGVEGQEGAARLEMLHEDLAEALGGGRAEQRDACRADDPAGAG